ncbi:MBL fold metallo-hydrolase [Hyphobacterium sp.]|uniref:MBL fold metallo-hydrolase n=1 Tax=Hyphobacterium sp. TaxID=2004662 RepID=UPI003BA9789E
MRVWVLILALFAVPAVKADVTIRFIANEGVYITNGETAVLIDALAWNSYDGRYALASDEARVAMIAGDPVYENVVALLFTHIHGDHFDPEGAAEYLLAQSDGTVAASPQITNAMLNGQIELSPQDIQRIFPVELTADAPGPWHHPIFDFIEGAWIFHREGVDNITWHVELDGISILHLGDTQPQIADFSVWDDTEFDVILYPYWFAQMPPGQAFLESRPESRAIAFHIPAIATPLTIRAGLGDREYFFQEGQEVVIETP